jgi:predicted Zn-dependent protease
MLVNNMESTFKIFFKGMSTIRVQPETLDNDGDGPAERNLKNAFSLQKLAAKRTVATRIRQDTGVKQYHAGHIFDYLKKNIKLANN